MPASLYGKNGLDREPIHDRYRVESGLAACAGTTLESGRRIVQFTDMHSWSPGYTQSELDDAQAHYGLRFPPDLVALLLERQLTLGYDWRGENAEIRRMLAWPLKMLMFDVENGFWWPDWGVRPNLPKDRLEVVETALQAAPRLIPLYGHRFLPETPSEAGNPVFSMHGFDTIYYGANLMEYFRNEFEGKHQIGSTRHILFWSDIVGRFEEAYAFYAESGKSRASVTVIQDLLRNKDA